MPAESKLLNAMGGGSSFIRINISYVLLAALDESVCSFEYSAASKSSTSMKESKSQSRSFSSVRKSAISSTVC
jgi:hypothetical protein